MVNFTNVLCAAFMCANPKSVRTQSSCQNHFRLLGSVCIKAVWKCWWNWHLWLISTTFYEQLLLHFPYENKLKTSCKHIEAVQHTFVLKKLLIKCWWNWHLGSNSPTCLGTAFTCKDPKSTKRHWWLDCLFTLLAS